MNQSGIFPFPKIDADVQVGDVDISATNPMPVADTGAILVPNGTDQGLTVDNTVGGVAFAAFPANTTRVLLTCDTAEVRYTLDASAPTTTNGHVLSIGDERVWSLAMVAAAKFIRTGTTSGYIHASPLRAA